MNFTIFSFHKTKGHKFIGGAMLFPPSQNFFYTQSEYLIIVCHVQSVIFFFLQILPKISTAEKFFASSEQINSINGQTTIYKTHKAKY